MKYETITKEQIESIVKTGKIKPVEEIEKENEEQDSSEKKTPKSRKPKATETEEEK